ncbi:hypothetical protein ABZ883_38345 [Streptomyces sp. NPDC046977]|uniref:hypothetical protein n=1 Tax=Streptomyces sp. NPDC046977 TaxID=3154703 RepID=UPI003409716D
MAAMMSGPAFRLARAAVFAAVCVTVTGLGHALMSEAIPGWAVGYALAATTASAWWLAGRKERGPVTVTVSTMATQGALHLWFGFAQHFADAPAVIGVTGGPAAHHPAIGMASMAASSGGRWPGGMTLAHACAALLCGVWLWRGEAALFRLGRSLAAFVFAPLRRAARAYAVTAKPLPSRSASFLAFVPPLHWAPLRYAVSRRGPPRSPSCC